MSEQKNIVASVKGRLLHIARSEDKNHQLLLLRYFQERFLYRLSKSRYGEHFCLKGAAFLYALEGESSRVTKDIDFLGSISRPHIGQFGKPSPRFAKSATRRTE